MTNGWSLDDDLVAKGQFYGVVPIFLVDDVGKAAEYYRDVLGFEVEFLYGETPTTAASRETTQSSTSPAAIRRAPATASRPAAPRFGADAVIVVSNVEDVYIEIQEKGANVIEKLAPREYGALDCMIEDLNGYRLTIGGDLEDDDDDDP